MGGQLRARQTAHGCDRFVPGWGPRARSLAWARIVSPLYLSVGYALVALAFKIAAPCRTSTFRNLQTSFLFPAGLTFVIPFL